MKVVPIIPSLDPDNKLILLVDNLIKYGYNKIIIIDDGTKNKIIFNKLKDYKECIILTHKYNKGKGEGLKTAFTYYKNNLINKYKGVICLDSDGQHSVEDIIKVSNKLLETDNFVLGTRLFNTKETPFRNKIGNRITTYLFKLLYKIYIKDTQTGLRAIPNRLIELHLNTEGKRFEYELNTLINLILNKEAIEEVDIKTIYLKNSNRHSHFNPIIDSYRVYKALLSGKRERINYE